jgi:hypothetical protein
MNSAARAQSRVARFFLVQHAKTRENIPHNHKMYQMAVKYVDQMAVKYVDQMAVKYVDQMAVK